MDHLNNNMTSCLRVTQQCFVMTSCLFLKLSLEFYSRVCLCIEVIKDQTFYDSST